ncbi:MAG: hypothetical protein FJZ47_12695 [Candidatus Tectomicrobia bacterium]|uniref:Uncharacterized protein n=1 Tax=Tectimicrobiota bacterium TaxID=2528274 RepID=A0A937W0P9_UNCTE|nr:hypothetical protein [Candidatus Tectomicrobia bacterium]
MALQQLTFTVHDPEGRAQRVLFTVDPGTATGELVLTGDGGATTQHRLTTLQKSQDGKRLTCQVNVATATLSIVDTESPPRLHIVARLFFPVLDMSYTLSRAEQERLVAWIQTLELAIVS